MINISTQFVTAGIMLYMGGVAGGYNAEIGKHAQRNIEEGPSIRTTPFAGTSLYRSNFIASDLSISVLGSSAGSDDFKNIVAKLTTKSISLSADEKRLINDNLFDLL